MGAQVGRADPLPERLADDEQRCEPVGIRLLEPAPVGDLEAVHRGVVDVDKRGLHLGDTVAELDALAHAAVGRRVGDRVPLLDGVHGLGERGAVDRGAGGRVGVGREGGGAAAAALEGLGRGLLGDAAESHDAREGGDRDGDADEAEEHAGAVDAQLGARLDDRADDGGEEALHSVTSGAVSDSTLVTSTGASTPWSSR